MDIIKNIYGKLESSLSVTLRVSMVIAQTIVLLKTSAPSPPLFHLPHPGHVYVFRTLQHPRCVHAQFAHLHLAMAFVLAAMPPPSIIVPRQCVVLVDQLI